MKTLMTLITGLCILPVSGQITMNNHAPRAGEEIIKQQVEYKDPGRSGENVVWNFKELKNINPEYKIKYFTPRVYNDSLYIMGKDSFPVSQVNKEDLLVALEHNTMYHYRFADNKLLLLGHESPTTIMKHEEPILIYNYQAAFNQEYNKNYHSIGLYSGRVPLASTGNITLTCDAAGKMILPSGDTLLHVIRIKSKQTIIEDDSISHASNDKLSMIIENYRWFAKGYRYPVFETIRTKTLKNDGEKEYFSTAFFYPPQEHYYLADDPENLAVLDSLWDGQIKYTENGGQLNPTDGFAYNYFPNPVETNLNIEFFLEDAATVSIDIFNNNGGLAGFIPKQNYQKGMYNKSINCSEFSSGNYILRLTVNQNIISEKILKK